MGVIPSPPEPERFSGSASTSSAVEVSTTHARPAAKRFVRQQVRCTLCTNFNNDIGVTSSIADFYGKKLTCVLSSCPVPPHKVLACPFDNMCSLFNLSIQVPDEILHNESLKTAMKVLPGNYSFEVCTSKFDSWIMHSRTPLVYCSCDQTIDRI
jgi:hypothetical protein